MKPNNKINFFDIDGTLWDIDAKVWIIDKEEPHKPILRLDNYEVNRILNDFYKKDNFKIEYNGEEYYISNILLKKLRFPIERLGISWIEFYNEDYINNTKTKFLFKNIKHLRHKNEFICLLSGRSHRDRHAEILNELRKKLKDIGIDIFKIYFVADKFIYKQSETVALNKTHILLEHLIGLKIEDGKFVSFKQDWFKDVYFYDDDKMNIDYANDIQMILDRLLKNTDDDLFKIIIDRLNTNELCCYNNLITNNDINNFETTKIVLKAPTRFPIFEHVKKFNDFK